MSQQPPCFVDVVRRSATPEHFNKASRVHCMVHMRHQRPHMTCTSCRQKNSTREANSHAASALCRTAPPLRSPRRLAPTTQKINTNTNTVTRNPHHAPHLCAVRLHKAPVRDVCQSHHQRNVEHRVAQPGAAEAARVLPDQMAGEEAAVAAADDGRARRIRKACRLCGCSECEQCAGECERAAGRQARG